MKTTSALRIWSRIRRSTVLLGKDTRGIAATEFAFIVPLMLVMLLGTIEFSSGFAAFRKVTLVARTLTDLVSQSKAVNATVLNNFSRRVTPS